MTRQGGPRGKLTFALALVYAAAHAGPKSGRSEASTYKVDPNESVSEE